MRPVRLCLIRMVRKHSQWYQTHPISSVMFGSFHFSKTYRRSKLPASFHEKSFLCGFRQIWRWKVVQKNSLWFSFMSTEWGEGYCALLPAHILSFSLSFIVDKSSGFLTLCCLSDALTNSKLFEITFQIGNNKFSIWKQLISSLVITKQNIFKSSKLCFNIPWNSFLYPKEDSRYQI